MKDTVWEAEFQGHKLRAINKFSLIPPKTSEVLEIDGDVVEHIKGSFFRASSTIAVQHRFGHVYREVEVRFGPKDGTSKTGCQIFVDGKQVGGDDSIWHTCYGQAPPQLSQGFLRYFLKTGLVKWGLPYAGILTAIDPLRFPIWMIGLRFIFLAAWFGIIMSGVNWIALKVGATKPINTSERE